MDLEEEEEKNENLLIDLRECYLLLSRWASSELILTCMPCVLKVASVKEESEEVQKEVEIALLALCEIGVFKVKQEQYLKEITEIIEHQQKHRNLTKLAYQSAWQFLMNRLFNDDSLEDTIVNELNFVKEATKELEALIKCMDWKKKDGEEKGGKEVKEEIVLIRWLRMIKIYYRRCRLWNEEFVWLVSSIVQLFRTAKDNYRGICKECIELLSKAANCKAVKVENLLKGAAFNMILEVIIQSTFGFSQIK
ncbi:uncharacterized protein MONOS_4498 [Monocercomonoides exilis]|uniref:uncharacterized protein n=1 Tax=Monocercomonoides exilis TaxID=2049356 RepID=UPI00355A9E4A|nr:hypothetical protein MONOS_4498 [Monocercomonoides exilis]|eukprot:MONOS_4498.1-p1 / transcript=MONOS_4498.1 / gene=MONOS_4498 / organism=Monocercomonoides_exilis_PA203 / gene_product=unspecified product / transcript_product=unspecified product / location=Mono_scaffold00120:64639-65453(+) / protein_length=251 / sequence_SO=supercontig / SO=protein_coding / is_pseudo=false